jgi:hypothetical protein
MQSLTEHERRILDRAYKRAKWRHARHMLFCRIVAGCRALAKAWGVEI